VPLDTIAGTASSPSTDSSRANKRIRNALSNASKLLGRFFDTEVIPQLGRKQLAVLGLGTMLLAVGVRLLHWQDKHVEIVAGKTALSGVFNRYLKEADRIIDDGSVLFPRDEPQNGDARLVAHPPGYSIVIAAISRLSPNLETSLWLLQILGDAVAVLLVFLIGLELLNCWVAIAAAMFAALSPHLAYYSLLLSPDSLAVVPILVAVYLVARGLKKPTLTGMVAAGSMIGLSCWLNANGLLLAPFLAVSILFVFKPGQRAKMAFALVASTIIVIAPLTIRNLIVFHRFIPLSIQAGLSLAEGIGDYDKEGTFGMPRSDREARQKDAEWNNRPDYAASLWVPDGVERDNVRLHRGFEVVRSNPAWFAGVMFKRAGFMLSYNDSRAREWPFNTASASPVTSEALYGHDIAPANDELGDRGSRSPVLVLNGAIISGSAAQISAVPMVSIEPNELLAKGGTLMPLATALLTDDGNLLEVTGDDSAYGDQFSSAPFSVKESTDYLLVVPLNLVRDDMALKVTSVDQRTSLSVVDIGQAIASAESADPGDKPSLITVQMPFASGARTQVRFVVSNNGRGSLPPVARLGRIQILEIGPTPYAWTSPIRKAIRSIQRKFTTGVILTLISLGFVLLLFARNRNGRLILLVVPLYYLILQSPLHTEYRYILAMHYFLFVFAGASVGVVPVALLMTSRWARKMSPQLRRLQSSGEPASANSPRTATDDRQRSI
jgi:hypothetical protein